MEELFSMIGPRDVTTAKTPKAQKTAAAEAVLNAASDSQQAEVAAPKTKVMPGPWADPEEKITVEQLRAAVKEKSTEHREALKKLLTQYDANNVSSLAKEHYHDFLTAVNNL